MTLFAVTWAAATLFHIWGGSGRINDIASNWTTVSAVQALAGVLAITVLVSPRSRVPLLLMATLGPVVAWFEAPLLGSHWMVVTFVDVALLASFGARGGRRFEETFLPLARWVLIGFYVFAAFNKLNHAFFTPEVSCATFYLDELAKSLHLTVHTQSGAGWTHLVPFGVAGVELSVPPLLLVRRTRAIGVVVGIAFHGFIAIDQTHLFADFSSVLNALFVLFLPATFATSVVERYRKLSEEGRERLRSVVILAAAILLAMQLYGRGEQVRRIFFDGQGWAWIIYDVALLVLVLVFVWAANSAPLEHPLSLHRAGVPLWLGVIPALVIFNGLTPYLELRTAYAWNMYANLKTFDGSSNHFLITRTLPVVDFQSDVVRIVDTSDPGLRLYIGQAFELPYLQLRDYLSRHRDASLTYIRGGVQHHVDRASDDPGLVRPVPSWESKSFAFRALDETDPPRCQPAFLPAL